MQYAGDFYSKACDVTDACDKSTLHNIFIDSMDAFTSQKL